jgi:Acetyltransferase (GNAT) domain
MATHLMSEQAYRRDLGAGLVLRWSTPADVEGLGRLYSLVFRPTADAPPDTVMVAWLHDLMSGRHPLIGPGDFALVEDTDRGAVVAATCLIRQDWEYEDIAFAVGRPELVASMPEYRNRGLIRAIFELIHTRSAANGQLAQGITGIHYYYRLFGYEYALDLGGSRSVYLAAIPKLKQGEPEPYVLRAATLHDLPQLLALYDRERARGPVSTLVGEAYWRWVLDGQSNQAGESAPAILRLGWRTHMIANSEGKTLGYILISRWRWGDALGVGGLALEQGVALAPLLPSLLRLLQAHALALPARKPDAPPAAKLTFALWGSHPVYDALGERVVAGIEQPYAWYVRVPDLPRFIRHIAPALERRLAASLMAGYTGELKIDFYRGGLRLAFADGRLVAAEDYRVEGWRPERQAGFPPLVFLQLLFGRRSLDELRHVLPDVWADDTGRVLLEALFPARPSWVLPLD